MKQQEKEFLQAHALYQLASDIYYGVDSKTFRQMLEPASAGTNKRIQFTKLVEILPDEMKKKLEEGFEVEDIKKSDNLPNQIIDPLFKTPIGRIGKAKKFLLEILSTGDDAEEKEEIFNRCKEELYEKIRTWFPTRETRDKVIKVIEKSFFSRKIIYSYETKEDFLCYTNQNFLDYLMNEELKFISIKSSIKELSCDKFKNFEDKFRLIRETKDTLLAEGDFFAIGKEEESGKEILINKKTDQKFKEILSLEGNLKDKNRGVLYEIYYNMVKKDPYEAITVVFLLSIFMSAIPEHKNDLFKLLFLNYDPQRNTNKVNEKIKIIQKQMKQMNNNITKITKEGLNSEKNKTSQSESSLDLVIEDIVKTDSYPNEGILKQRFRDLSKIDGTFYKNNSELCFLNYFIFKNYNIMTDEINDLFNCISKEQLLDNCYKYCYQQKENHSFESAYARKYFGLSFAEYAQFLYEHGEEGAILKSIIEKAKKYLKHQPDFLVELEADLRMKGFAGYPSGNKDYKMIHKLLKDLYIKTGKESLIEKMIMNLESAKENKGAEAGDALRQIKRLYSQKVDNNKTVKEKYIERIQQEAMDKYEKRQKQIGGKKEETVEGETVDDNGIYIVTGMGDATEAFLNSAVNRPSAIFFVVPQDEEKADDNFMKRVTGKIVSSEL